MSAVFPTLSVVSIVISRSLVSFLEFLCGIISVII